MLNELSALLDVLKAKGVTRFSGPGSLVGSKETLERVLVEFGPSAPVETPETKQAPPIEPDTCACGHGLHEHQNGLCLHACEPEKCGEKP